MSFHPSSDGRQSNGCRIFVTVGVAGQGYSLTSWVQLGVQAIRYINALDSWVEGVEGDLLKRFKARLSRDDGMKVYAMLGMICLASCVTDFVRVV